MTAALLKKLDSIAAKGIDTNEWLTFSSAFTNGDNDDKSARNLLTPWILLFPTLAHLASVETSASFTEAIRHCTKCYPLATPSSAQSALAALETMAALYDNVAFETNWAILAQAITDSVGSDPIYTGDFSCD